MMHGWMVQIVMSSTAKQAVPPCAETHEILFSSIMRGLLVEGNVPAGSLVDAGANTGNKACHYAAAAPERVVHATINNRVIFLSPDCAVNPSFFYVTSIQRVEKC